MLIENKKLYTTQYLCSESQNGRLAVESQNSCIPKDAQMHVLNYVQDHNFLM
uniref:Uncharacterized protein n=1 Tax=Arundo donax TaxID=35708 RepID=A0A0A8Z8S9_ARUDO